MKFDYNHIFENALRQLRSEGRYRVFNNITRKLGEFPKAVLAMRWALNPMLRFGVATIILAWDKTQK